MTPYPLSAIVGQDDLKLALLLHAVDPKLGGVLIRGEKGSGKSTAARALATLLGEAAPFVELPIGATEDRVVGTLDLEGALLEGRTRLRPGLLAAAHGGVLYVDEVNLLADHLVDVLIDAAAFGINRVERDGLTAEHPSRFVLVGSMNPEEGELRPQLLDRFGLAVEVRAPRDPEQRTEVVRRRLAFDADPAGFAERYAASEEALRGAISGAAAILGDVVVPDEVLAFTSRLCAELDAEGLRADLVLARGIAALAALDGRKEATADDVVRLAPLALAHRRRRGPLDAPGLAEEDLSDALERAHSAPPDSGEHSSATSEAADTRHQPEPGGAGGQSARPPSPGISLALRTQRPSGVLGRRNRGPADRGGIVAARPSPEGVTDIAVAATVQAAAARRAARAPDAPAAMVERADLRQAVREARTANLVVLCVDSSGSMGAARRIDAAKGAAVSLLLDAYQRRDRVALVTFAGDDARVALRPTGSVEVARARLADLPTGGRTPLGPGLRAALDVARSARHRDPDRRPVIVVVTDGRATSAGPSAGETDPIAAALAAAGDIAAAGIEALVVDAEDSDVRLGLARRLADTMGASYTSLPDMQADSLARVVEAVVAAEPPS
ncbi:MAG TPA: VWA domain-containing protein [Acidimicrobiia bacterium]|nr:VWA domain-containing protein [Acidimicrobiia bacterium]